MRTAVQTARLVECRKTGGGETARSTSRCGSGQQDDIDEATRDRA